ncbi:MAG: pyridoxamine 5'-phosphate oxidase family protein [Pseudomonadota bacterium]
MKHFGDIMFTDTVKAEQARRGSREAYEKMTASTPPKALTAREVDFIGHRDSFYMATVTETGWPYVQHRGGPKGFLKALAPTQLGFADYRGNRQYVSVGNLQTDQRTALFLMDYPNRRRLKLLARATVMAAEDDPALAARLASDGEGRVERLFRLDIEAFDWNCPQFITPRFDEGAAMDRLETLEAENAALRSEIAAMRRQSSSHDR